MSLTLHVYEAPNRETRPDHDTGSEPHTWYRMFLNFDKSRILSWVSPNRFWIITKIKGVLGRCQSDNSALTLKMYFKGFMIDWKKSIP